MSQSPLRPALFVFFLILAGTWAGLGWSGRDGGTVILCILAGVCVLAAWPMKAASTGICICLFLAGGMRSASIEPGPLRLTSLDGSNAIVTGRIAGLHREEGRIRVFVETWTVNRRRLRARVSFILIGDPAAEEWDDIEVTGRIDTGRMTFNQWTDGFENAPFFLRGASMLSWKTSWCVFFIRPIARRIAGILESSSGPTASRLMQQLFLGRVWAGERIDMWAYSESGLIHILAVSGMHVSVLSVAASAVVSFSRVGPIGRAASILAILAVFSALTGFRPSVVRAAMMAGFAGAGRASGRDPEGLNCLGAAGVVMVAWNPVVVMDMGFILSFAATGALMTALHPTPGLPGSASRGRSGGGTLAGGCAETIKVLAMISPLLARLIGNLPLQSIVAGPLAAVLALCLLKTALLISLAGALFPAIASGIGPFADFLASALEVSAAGASRFGFLNLSLPRPSPVILAAAYAILGSGLVTGIHLGSGGVFSILRSSALLLAPWIVILTHGFFATGASQAISLQIIDCGQGSCILATSPGGERILIDTGPGKAHGRRGLGALLRDLGVRSLDAVVLTHFHDDHTGGISEVAQMCKTLVCGPGMTGQTAKLLPSAGRLPQIVEVHRGINHDLGGISLDFLWPPAESVFSGQENENARSLVFTLRTRSLTECATPGEALILLTGDLEGKGLAVVADDFASLCKTHSGLKIISLPHHGSKGSFYESLYDFAGLVILQRGRNNRHGHPSPIVVKALGERDIEILDTALLGRISICIEAGVLSIGSQISYPGGIHSNPRIHLESGKPESCR